MEYVDRYSDFKNNNLISIIPFIEIPNLPTDKNIVYKTGITRLDVVSQNYYGNPYHGWLIMLANPEYGGMEFDIPNNTIIRIPFPFSSVISNYEFAVQKYKQLNE
jgi:hypothetical protein